MFSFTEEIFLREFFIFDATVGKFCDRHVIFNCLAQNYYVNRERADELYKLAVSNNVDNIISINDYNRYCRLRQYRAVHKTALNAQSEDDIITVKGAALKIVHECGLIDFGNSTKASVYTRILEKAKAGYIVSLRLCGVLQSEGIFFEENIENGKEYLIKSARWNNIESIVPLLKYDCANAEKYIDMLFTLAVGTPYEDIYKNAQSHCGAHTHQKINECILLSTAFGRELLVPNMYVPVYADLLYSKVICFNDKEKILLSGNKNTVTAYANLPLKLVKRDLAFDSSTIIGLSLARCDVQDGIIQNAINSDMRDYNMFRPLCLNSNSRIMRNYYASAINKLFDGANIVRISVGDLCPYDFDLSPNNVFVRNCAEDKNNVFILELVGDINDAAQEEVCSFLQSERRKKMRLATMGIDIDLSSVLPICLCDKNNAQALERYCEIIKIVPPDMQERTILIQEMITEKIKQYGIVEMDIENSVMAKLCAVSIDSADAALDAAISANRSVGKSLTLTAENAEKYIVNRESAHAYGYGG